MKSRGKYFRDKQFVFKDLANTFRPQVQQFLLPQPFFLRRSDVQLGRQSFNALLVLSSSFRRALFQEVFHASQSLCPISETSISFSRILHTLFGYKYSNFCFRSLCFFVVQTCLISGSVPRKSITLSKQPSAASDTASRISGSE